LRLGLGVGVAWSRPCSGAVLALQLPVLVWERLRVPDFLLLEPAPEFFLPRGARCVSVAAAALEPKLEVPVEQA